MTAAPGAPDRPARGTRLDRAAQLYAAGLAANEDMSPALGRRRLRAALRALGGADDAPEARALRGRVTVSLAMAEAELGRAELGLALLDEAAPLVSEDRRGVLHAQRALVLRRTGRDDRALVEYDAALAMLEERAQPQLVAKVLLNRAVLLTAAGRLRAARRDAGRCLDLARASGDEVLVAKARHDLGFLEYTAGNLPAALRRYREAEPSYRRLLPGNLAMLGLDRARALVAAGMVTEADRELAHSVPQLGRQRSVQDQAEGLLVRAEAALLDGRAADARRFAGAAHRLFARRDNPRWAARALLTAARADLAAADRAVDGSAPPRAAVARVAAARSAAARSAPPRSAAARAAAAGDRAEELHDELARLGLAEDARTAALVAARCRLRAHDVTAARRLLAGGEVRAERLETTLLRRAARAELAAAEGRHRDAAGERRRGLQSLHRARARLGALDLQGGAAVLGRELAEAGLSAALRGGTPRQVFGWAERARAQALLLRPVRPQLDGLEAWQELRATTLALSAAELDGRPTMRLRARREALRREVRHATWSAAGSGDSAQPIALAAARAALGPRAMVVYVADGSDLHALVVTGHRTRLVPLGPRAAAEEATLRLRADLDVQAAGALPGGLAQVVRAATRHDALALGAVLVDPVGSLVGDRELVVVPTGGLVTVPWSALPQTAGRAVTVASSATTWARRQAPPQRGDAGTLLATGPRIPWGEGELAAITALADRRVTVLDQRAATVSATLRELATADVAHLAAHGHHETDNPLFSGLELVDGLLMGYDLLALPRTPRLVVLSSCDLGLHDTRPGDESLGTASALLAAGASTVVASVSRVNDETAMRVMVDFHRGLLAGHGPAAALAGATADRSTGFVCFGAG